MTLTLEELVNAPLLPSNLPQFEIIKECRKVRDRELESVSEDGSLSDLSDTNSDFDDIEEVFPCECKYDEHSPNPETQACGSLANCINRELFIECDSEECPCRERCQNQRFNKRQYANVKVIETPGKGFGLFTCQDLKSGSLVMEYVGEVVNQDQMARRAELYASQNQPHFYFMTLRPDQIIDATCCGNLARFMNHSCLPNCETQKWIVDGRIRIGLFTLKNIKAGTELTFDYKFVRFGKEPQKCLCGEAVCTGFIGVAEKDAAKKTNARRGRKKTANEEATTLISEDDIEDDFEQFMESEPTCANSPSEVSILVSKLIKTTDLELTRKLLILLERTSSHLCQRKFLSLHGLKLLGTIFSENFKDPSLIALILGILENFKLTQRNAIEESNWFDKLGTIQESKELSDDILQRARNLQADWETLENVFKIPRKLKDENKVKSKNSSSTGSSADVNTNKTSSAPTSVLMNVPSEFSSALQRKRQYTQEDSGANSESLDVNYDTSKSSRSRSRSPEKSAKMIPDPLWLSAQSPDGKTYYYHSVSRETRWEQPMILAPKLESGERDDGRNNERYKHRENDRRDYSDRGHNRRDYTDRERSRRDYSDRTQDRGRGRDQRDNLERDRDRNTFTTRNRDEKSKYISEDNYKSANRRDRNINNNLEYIEGVQDSKELAAIIERAKARRANQSETETTEIISDPVPTIQSPQRSSGKKNYAKLKEEISGVVIRFFSHYRNELGDEFKDLARKYTHKIIDKEMKELNGAEDLSLSLTSKKKHKIKSYLTEVIQNKGIKLIREHEM